MLHVGFWLLYYAGRVLLYAGFVNTWENVMLVQAAEMPVKMAVVYLNLRVLMPRLLKPRHDLLYGAAVAGSLLLGGVIQREVIGFCVDVGIYKPMSAEVLYSRFRFFSILSHIIEILVLTTIIKVIKEAYQAQQAQQQIDRNRLQNELRFLKAQLNPHFFFNTLNNLYALTLAKSDRAPEMVLKLSGLMRHMIDETGKPAVPLASEVQFLENYLDLERLRYDTSRAIEFEILGNPDTWEISPLLLIPLAENCFKHAGTAQPGKRWIHLSLRIPDDGQLVFETRNPARVHPPDSSRQGIGLENLRRQLELLYPNAFQLLMFEANGWYTATLKLQLKPRGFAALATPLA